MKKLQRGFSALELIMVMAVSAIMMTVLLEIYNQVMRNMVRVDRFVFEDTQLLTLRNRFEQDLAGLSAVWFTQADVEGKKLAAEGKKAEGQEASFTKASPDTVGGQAQQTSQYFYSVNKNKNLDMLTFVTTNALQSYGNVQDRFVRVVYKVEQDFAHAGMFRLMRKEIPLPTESIDEQKNEKQKTFYELVGGIKSIEMTYQLVDKTELQKRSAAEKEEGKNITKSASQENKPIIRSVKQWKFDDKKSTEKKDTGKNDSSEDLFAQVEEENLGGVTVPKFVTMKIIFGATNQQLEKEYKLEFYIPSSIDNMVKLPGKQPAITSPAPDGSGVKIGGQNP
ncbi:MAG: type II secretion system protein [Candidatus Chromulinivorax sp.]|nr:type II secretion system protein [Candidatus Chromulinivorax sp.]